MTLQAMTQFQSLHCDDCSVSRSLLVTASARRATVVLDVRSVPQVILATLTVSLALATLVVA